MVSGKKELKVYLGITWAKPAALEPFLETFAQTPLTWVFPAYPVLEKRGEGHDKLFTELKARVSRLGDEVIPTGYADAPHPLLTVRELAKELAWSLHNPWSSGVLDVFKKNPDILIPASADFGRDKAMAAYLAQGFRAIGNPLDTAASVYRFWGTSPRPGLATFNYIDFSAIAAANPARLAKSLFPRDLDQAFLLVRPTGRDMLAPLSALLAELGKRRALALTVPGALGAPADLPAGSTRAAASTAIEDTPFARELREKAARLRDRGDLKNQDLREIIVLTAGEPAAIEKARAALTAKPIVREGTSYTANMPGEILLPGSSFDAFFSRGRLIDLKRGDTSFLPSGPPRAFIRLAGKEQPLVFDRIFSFEKNEVRGLETFVLSPGPARGHFFTLRYAFAGESPWLLVNGEILRRPDAPLDRLEAVVPLEIPVGECSAEAPLVIRRFYADGSVAESVFTGDEPPTAIAGTVFSIIHGDKHLAFGYSAHKSEPIHLLEVRVVRDKRRRTVAINPFGAYRRETLGAMIEAAECRSFYIGIREEAPDKTPFFPAAVNKAIPAHALFRME